jgi:pSer/pThr/pTyr-binding forkhead associated (FHA) protein/tetratricopeptide (TPR) repeat protein
MTERQVELVVYRGDTLLQRISLPHGTLTFGRSEDCDLCLEDISVSRRHGQFTLSAEEILFEDLGSGNGSWFKGQRIRSQLLEDGDEVIVEPFRLQVEALIELDTATSGADNGDRTLMLSRSDAQGILESDYPEARLEILAGVVNESSFILDGQLLSIGRSEQRDIILSDKAASRLHCEVVPLKGAYWIRDSGSANGVKVNGAPVAEHELVDGDIISIGETQIRFLSDEVIGSKTDVLSAENTSAETTANPGDRTEAFVNVMAPDQGWSLDQPAAPLPESPSSNSSLPTPEVQAPPDFPLETLGDPDATIEPRDDDAPPIFAPLPDSSGPESGGFGESNDNSIDYGISPELGEAAGGDWGFGGALHSSRDGSLVAQKAPGSGIFGNWVRTTIVGLLICSVGLVVYKKLSDAGVFSSSSPAGGSQEIYFDSQANPSLLDPNILARTNQLMDEGRQAFAREDYFAAFQKYFEVSAIDPSSETARREQVRACEMVAVSRLKGKVSADEATVEQKRAALEAGIAAAETALSRRQGIGGCQEALKKVREGKALNPGNERLEELETKLRGRISYLVSEGKKRTKETIAAEMRPLIASGSRNYTAGRYANAIADFERALSKDPNRANIDLVQQAEDGLERAKNKRRGEARRHYQEAARYFNSTDSADLRRARTSLRQALGIDPEFTSASTKLNAVTRELRARAKEEYDKGKVMLSASQYERARLHFQKVISLLDDPSDSMYQKAREAINSMGPG